MIQRMMNIIFMNIWWASWFKGSSSNQKKPPNQYDELKIWGTKHELKGGHHPQTDLFQKWGSKSIQKPALIPLTVYKLWKKTFKTKLKSSFGRNEKADPFQLKRIQNLNFKFSLPGLLKEKQSISISFKSKTLTQDAC